VLADQCFGRIQVWGMMPFIQAVKQVKGLVLRDAQNIRVTSQNRNLS
jgi:hypothetical protein